MSAGTFVDKPRPWPSLRTCVLYFYFLSSTTHALNTYVKESSSPNEDIWRSTSDFTVTHGTSYGTLRIGREMSAEFDMVWNSRVTTGWENLFRVGYTSATGFANCEGTGARYPSLWVRPQANANPDALHVSVSTLKSCQPSAQFTKDYALSLGTEYHVLLWYNQTLLTVDVGPTATWGSSGPAATFEFSRVDEVAGSGTDPAHIGTDATVFFSSDDPPGLDPYVAGDATFRNVVFTSRFFSTDPTTSPTPEPTDVPTATPTAAPTTSPSDAPTTQPTTAAPSQSPTDAPSTTPTNAPTFSPTVLPTPMPSTLTGQPTTSPTLFIPTTAAPTGTPTAAPTDVPTGAPTSAPTDLPSTSPSDPPTTATPSKAPTDAPSTTPTNAPTVSPTALPTQVPSATPSQVPSTTPTNVPTDAPSATPTAVPTGSPTTAPSTEPTSDPTTAAPSVSPTDLPSQSPTSTPTRAPTDVGETYAPTSTPTQSPTNTPSASPTDEPTTAPTIQPTNNPSTSPTSVPTQTPTVVPTSTPSSTPTNQPSTTGSPTTATPTTARPSTTPITMEFICDESCFDTADDTGELSVEMTFSLPTEISYYTLDLECMLLHLLQAMSETSALDAQLSALNVCNVVPPVITGGTPITDSSLCPSPPCMSTTATDDATRRRRRLLQTSSTATVDAVLTASSTTMFESVTDNIDEEQFGSDFGGLLSAQFPEIAFAVTVAVQLVTTTSPPQSTQDKEEQVEPGDDSDFWNSEPYTSIFYGAIGFVALLLIVLLICCYWKFKPPKDFDAAKPSDFEISGNTSGKHTSVLISRENIGSSKENMAAPVADGYPMNGQYMLTHTDVDTDGDGNGHHKGGGGGAGSTSRTEASDEDVLGGAYGGHITAGGGDDPFPRDKRRAINEQDGFVAHGGMFHPTHPANHQNPNVITPMDMHAKHSDRGLDTDEDDDDERRGLRQGRRDDDDEEYEEEQDEDEQTEFNEDEDEDEEEDEEEDDEEEDEDDDEEDSEDDEEEEDEQDGHRQHGQRRGAQEMRGAQQAPPYQGHNYHYQQQGYGLQHGHGHGHGQPHQQPNHQQHQPVPIKHSKNRNAAPMIVDAPPSQYVDSGEQAVIEMITKDEIVGKTRRSNKQQRHSNNSKDEQYRTHMHQHQQEERTNMHNILQDMNYDHHQQYQQPQPQQYQQQQHHAQPRHYHNNDQDYHDYDL